MNRLIHSYWVEMDYDKIKLEMVGGSQRGCYKGFNEVSLGNDVVNL